MVSDSVQAYKPPKRTVELFKANRKLLMGSLLAGMDQNRFIRAAWFQVSTNPDIAACTPESILNALIQCGQQGLYPDGVNGYAYLVPFGKKATYIRGYKGLVKLFASHPRAADLPVICEIVYEGDTFDYELGANPRITHKPGLDQGKPIAVYAVFRFKDGSYYPNVMSYQKALDFKKYAKTKTIWNEHEEAMVKKTCIKQGVKLIPLADSVADQLRRDSELEEGNAIDALDTLGEDVDESLGITEPKALAADIQTAKCAKCKKVYPADKLMDSLCSGCADLEAR